MTETATVGVDGIGERVDAASTTGLVTKWLSVRALEGDAAIAEGVDGTEPDGSLTLVASTDQEDRAGDVISASGWELAAYRENPVFLWAHDYRRPAIGRSVRTWVQDGPAGGRLMATIEFAPTPFAQEIRSLYAAGFMRGVSVGFRALEMEPRTGSAGRRGVLFKRQELLEISATPVPVNAGALIRERMTGVRGQERPYSWSDGGARAQGAQGVKDGGELEGQETLPTSPAIPSPAITAAMAAIPEAKKEIREFWNVLAALAWGEWKSSETDAAGGN